MYVTHNIVSSTDMIPKTHFSLTMPRKYSVGGCSCSYNTESEYEKVHVFLLDPYSHHCVKSVRVQSYSGPNTGKYRSNSKYGHFSRSALIYYPKGQHQSWLFVSNIDLPMIKRNSKRGQQIPVDFPFIFFIPSNFDSESRSLVT